MKLHLTSISRYFTLSRKSLKIYIWRWLFGTVFPCDKPPFLDFSRPLKSLLNFGLSSTQEINHTCLYKQCGCYRDHAFAHESSKINPPTGSGQNPVAGFLALLEYLQKAVQKIVKIKKATVNHRAWRRRVKPLTLFICTSTTSMLFDVVSQENFKLTLSAFLWPI